MRRILMLASLALCLSVPLAMAQETSKKPKTPASATPAAGQPPGQVRATGQVYVGELAPDFTLSSADGRETTLSQFRGDWVVLHFVPDRRDFARLQAVYAELREMGVTMVGVCKDNPQSLRSQGQRDSISFVMLADATGEISEIYGLYDSAALASRSGLLVLDRGGKVRLALMGTVSSHTLVDLVRFTMTGL